MNMKLPKRLVRYSRRREVNEEDMGVGSGGRSDGDGREKVHCGADLRLEAPARHWVKYQCRWVEVDRYAHT